MTKGREKNPEISQWLQVFMQEIEVRSWIHQMYLRHMLQNARYEEKWKIRNEVEKWALKDSLIC
jgi:hypothetical protein